MKCVRSWEQPRQTVNSRLGGRFSLWAHICPRLYLGMEGHPCVRRRCVSVWERAQLDSRCWLWLGDSLSASSRAPPAPLWKTNVNNSVVSVSVASEAVAHHPRKRRRRKATSRQNAEEENSDARLKHTPEVAAIAGIRDKKGTFPAYRAVSF